MVDLLDAAVDRGAAITANRLLDAVMRFFNWCAERGIVEASPVARIKALPRMKDGEADSPFVFTATGKIAISGFSKAKVALDRAVSTLLNGDGEDARGR